MKIIIAKEYPDDQFEGLDEADIIGEIYNDPLDFFNNATWKIEKGEEPKGAE